MLKLLKNFTKREWILVLISTLLIIGQVWLDLRMPDYMANITKLVQTQGSSLNELLKNGAYMLGCALGSMGLAVLVGYLTSNISATFSKNVRRKVFCKVENLSMNEIKQFSTSSLITRTTNDVTHIEILLSMGMHLIIKAPITAVWAVSKILNKSWQFSIITAVAVVILLTTISIVTSIVIPKFKVIQKLTDKLNGVTRENLTGIRVVRAFNAEQYQENKFENVNEELTYKNLFIQRGFSIFSPIMYLVMHGLTLAIYFVGANLIEMSSFANKLSLFGDMVVFSAYAIQVIISFLMLAIVFMMLPRAQVSAKRINEVMESEETVKQGKYDKDESSLKGYVEFKNVSFKYPDADEYLLKNISFKANQGETVAFIGSTGSGKSTLINLVPRFYDVTEGEVLVDGVNVKEYTFEFLNNKIGYVPQKAVLFNDSVAGNVAYGKSSNEKTDNQIKEAIRIAQATNFVESMDDKYDSHIAQGGTNISGGQKQRLAIARAIARKPEIYIFDDSFSALDYKTDAVLRKELKKHTKDATSLIVAQRIGTIMNADKIVVLENGECVGIGTHQELFEKCNVYKQIALSQLTEEELTNGR